MRSLHKVLKDIDKYYETPKGLLPANKSDNTYQNFENFDLPKLNIQLTGQKMIDLSLVIQTLQNQYNLAGIPMTVEAVHYNFILEDGVLSIPIKLKIKRQYYFLFLIYNERDAAIFVDARNRLQSLKKYRTVYLSEIPMTGDRSSQSSLTSLKFDHFRWESKKIPLENYAVWWPTKKEPTFKGSKTFRDLEQISTTLRGYESYFIGRFFKALKIPEFTDKEVKRIALPKGTRTLSIIGPEEQNIILSFSKEKGILLHFDRFNTPFGYRAAIIDQLCIAIQAYTIKLQLRDLPRDKSSSRGVEWLSEVEGAEVIGLV